jgi:aryl sulfotransferase
MRRYATEDGERWAGFVHRPGDIVISTRSKCGTTWMQMICALLVFQQPELPAPLADISPWLDWPLRDRAEVFAQLEAQDHRRIIKTHTPLDGFPLARQVTYVVVARSPLDVAVSYFHHRQNLDRDRVAEILGRAPEAEEPMDQEEFVRQWIESDEPIEEQLDTLRGNVHHLVDAQSRQGQLDVVIVHYANLEDDLEGAMRSLALHLGIAVPDERWPELVDAARFDAMAARATALAPDGLGVFRDSKAFFRTGRSGDGAASLTPDLVARYRSRLAELAPPDVAAWLDR